MDIERGATYDNRIALVHRDSVPKELADAFGKTIASVIDGKAQVTIIPSAASSGYEITVLTEVSNVDNGDDLSIRGMLFGMQLFGAKVLPPARVSDSWVLDVDDDLADMILEAHKNG